MFTNIFQITFCAFVFVSSVKYILEHKFYVKNRSGDVEFLLLSLYLIWQHSLTIHLALRRVDSNAILEAQCSFLKEFNIEGRQFNLFDSLKLLVLRQFIVGADYWPKFKRFSSISLHTVLIDFNCQKRLKAFTYNVTTKLFFPLR